MISIFRCNKQTCSPGSSRTREPVWRGMCHCCLAVSLSLASADLWAKAAGQKPPTIPAAGPTCSDLAQKRQPPYAYARHRCAQQSWCCLLRAPLPWLGDFCTSYPASNHWHAVPKINLFDPTEGAFAPAAVREDKGIARLLNAAGCGGGVLIEEDSAFSSSISTPPPQPAAFNKRAISLSSLTAAGAKAPSVGSKKCICWQCCCCCCCCSCCCLVEGEVSGVAPTLGLAGWTLQSKSKEEKKGS